MMKRQFTVNLFRAVITSVILCLGTLSAGCGSAPCGEVCDRLKGCQLEPCPPKWAQCVDAKAECSAKCVINNNATCDDLKAALTGTPNELARCMVACEANK
jgi:hypothetical protein